jgi:hypothetical protein
MTSSVQVDVNLKITISTGKGEPARDIHVSALLNRKTAIGTVSGRIVNREQLGEDFYGEMEKLSHDCSDLANHHLR